MKILRLKIIHQESILLKSTSIISNFTVNSVNKILYFKIDSKNPDVNIPSDSRLELDEYFKIELTEGTYVVNSITGKNDELANEIDLQIRSADSYYASFPSTYKFCYIDDNLKLVIRSLTLSPYSSVKLFNSIGDSLIDEILFSETYIKGVQEKLFNNYIKNEIIKFSVLVETSDMGNVNITEQILPDINGKTNLYIYSLDPENFYIIPNSYDPSLKTIDILARKEGSGIIKAIYNYDEETFYYSRQFLCHDSFFKDNYLTYLLTFHDANNIRNNQFVKSIFDTLMEMLDILYAYNEDLKVIPNFSLGKSKFISLLAQNLGFEKIDFTDFNTKYESSNNETFRELISNIFDLVSVRGTRLTYDLFFNALGYITTIQEFWYDSDGNLIEINEENESQSTFYAYTKEGGLVDNPPYPRPDPRKNNNLLTNDYNNFGNYVRILNDDGSISFTSKGTVDFTDRTNNFDVNVVKNNKSNYVRVIINNSLNDNVFQDPQDFSIEKKLLIRKYLDFLRPSHIQYILETFQQDLPNEVFDIFGNLEENLGISELETQYLLDEISFIFEEENKDFNIGDVKNNIEELSYFNNWDTLLKFDQQNLFDFKVLLVEELSIQKENI